MTDPLIQVPFRGGPNETKDDRSLEPGEVVSLTNVSYDADGEYQLRFGYTNLATPTASTSSWIKRLYVDGSELILNDGHSLFSFDPNAGAFASKDTIPEYQVTHEALVNSSTSFTSWGSAYGNGYRVAAWIDASDGFIRATVFDATTGAVVFGPIVVSSGVWLNLTVGVVGTTAVIVAISASPSVAAFTLALNPIATWSGGTVISDANLTVTTGIFGVAFLTSTFIVAYQHGNAGAAQTLQLRSFNAALTLASNVQSASSGLTGPFTTVAAAATLGGSAFIGVTASGGTPGGTLFQVDATALTAINTGTLTTPTNIGQTSSSLYVNARASSVCMPTATSAVWAVEAANQTVTGSCIAWASFNSSGALVGVPMGAIGVGLGSGLLYSGSAQFPTTLVFLRAVAAGAGTGLPLLATYILADLQTANTAALITPRWLATLSPNAANNAVQPSSPIPPAFIVGPNGDYECALAIMRTAAGRQGLDLFVLTQKAPLAVQLGKEFYIGGSYYDGVTACEDGFVTPPQITAAVNASGNASFQWCCTWVRVDSTGNIEESAPSQVISLNSANTPNVTITAVCLHSTNKQRVSTSPSGPTVASGSVVFLRVYRTPNTANGDSTFYLVTNDPMPSNCKNNLLSASITYTDTLSDGTLSDGASPVLYTTSGELVHNAPETFVSIVSHNDRIWGIAADLRTVWFSQTYTDGVVPAWTILQSFTVDDANEPLVALASLYDKLLVFTRNRVYVVYGDGPSIAGTNSDLQPPLAIPTANGCIEPRSIVTTPAGVFYQSARGIEVIDNGLNPSFAGMPVSVTTASFPVCTSAVMCGSTSTVRFTFVTSEAYPPVSNAGRSVVFDLRRNLWTVHSLSWAAGVDAPISGAAYHPLYGYVTGGLQSNTATSIARENTTADAEPWVDQNGTLPTLAVTTAWIKAGDLQGFTKIRRVYLLAKYYDQHALNVSFNYNYAVSGETHTYNAATVASLVTGNQEQVRMIPVGGRCESIQAVISAQGVANTSGRACGLTGLAFEVHLYKGGMRDVAVAGKS
jgi:hypothetical protein